MEDIIKLQKFFSELNEIEKKYPTVTNEEFNIFRVLHKEHDERRLHSRFLAFLLSPDGSHGKGDLFLNDFLETVKLPFAKIESAKVYPTEKEKSEEDKIDILIKNNELAIIIENKIFAGDSNKPESNPEEEPTKDKEPIGQIARYYKQVIDKHKIPEEKIFVFYLTLDKHAPSIDSFKDENGQVMVKLKNKTKPISYTELIPWLKSCAKDSEPPLKNSIEQYISLIKKIFGDVDKRKEIIKITGILIENLNNKKYWDDLYNEIRNEPTLIDAKKLLADNWKHIKWHTVADFWRKLEKELKNHYKNIKTYWGNNKDFNETITKVTHKGKDINHGILFDIEDGKTAYISGYNTLSWGIEKPKMWGPFKGKNMQNINFHEFSTANTFQLINRENMNEIIEAIIGEISEEQKNNFRNLKTE